MTRRVQDKLLFSFSEVIVWDTGSEARPHWLVERNKLFPAAADWWTQTYTK